MEMRLEIDMPEHQYNNIMSINSMSLGRMPYKGIIMYAINAIKRGKVLEQEPRWIPCDEQMPEEREWIGTKRFGTTISAEVYVTFENPDGVRFAKHLCFQNGKLSNLDQLTIDTFYKGAVPIAWMPLPKAYMPESEEL